MKKTTKSAGKTESAKQMEIIQKLVWPKVHLLTSTNLYTIEDLIEIERETFLFSSLQPLLQFIKVINQINKFKKSTLLRYPEKVWLEKVQA